MTLCLEWLDYPFSSVTATAENMDTKEGPASHFGNYVAIGTLKPEIEIYSINLLDSIYPDAMLNNPKETAAHVPEPAGMGKKKRKKSKHHAASKAHHIDAILSVTKQQFMAGLDLSLLIFLA